MVDYALAVALLVVILSAIDVLRSLGQQRVDQASELMRSGAHRLGFVEPGAQPPVVGTQGGLALA